MQRRPGLAQPLCKSANANPLQTQMQMYSRVGRYFRAKMHFGVVHRTVIGTLKTLGSGFYPAVTGIGHNI